MPTWHPVSLRALAVLVPITIAAVPLRAQSIIPGGTSGPPIPPKQICDPPIEPDFLGGWTLVEHVSNWEGPVEAMVVADGQFPVDSREIENNCGDNFFDSCADIPGPIPYSNHHTVTTTRGYDVSAGYRLQASSSAHAEVGIKLVAKAAVEVGLEHEISFQGSFHWEQSIQDEDIVGPTQIVCGQKLVLEISETRKIAKSEMEIAEEVWAWVITSPTILYEITYCNKTTATCDVRKVTGRLYAFHHEDCGDCWCVAAPLP